MKNGIIKGIITFLIISIVVLAIGLLIALPISKYAHASYNDVVFIEGIIITVFSLYFSIQGNPSGLNLQGLGSENAQCTAYSNIETTRRERNFTDYFKNFEKHSVLNLTFRKLAIVFGGILLITSSAFGI